MEPKDVRALPKLELDWRDCMGRAEELVGPGRPLSEPATAAFKSVSSSSSSSTSLGVSDVLEVSCGLALLISSDAGLVGKAAGKGEAPEDVA
jgi:hypothetical protein